MHRWRTQVAVNQEHGLAGAPDHLGQRKSRGRLALPWLRAGKDEGLRESVIGRKSEGRADAEVSFGHARLRVLNFRKRRFLRHWDVAKQWNLEKIPHVLRIPNAFVNLLERKHDCCGEYQAGQCSNREIEQHFWR